LPVLRMMACEPLLFTVRRSVVGPRHPKACPDECEVTARRHRGRKRAQVLQRGTHTAYRSQSSGTRLRQYTKFSIRVKGSRELCGDNERWDQQSFKCLEAGERARIRPAARDPSCAGL
jgi:hypothetical protein